MTGLYDEAFLEDLRLGAERVAPEWGLSPRTTVSLMSISENATFRADDPDRARPAVLRVHRPNYHSRHEIESEIAWIDALRQAGVVDTPAPLHRRGGGRIATFVHRGETRHVTAFEFVDGIEPQPGDDLSGDFERLGAISARLHAHARAWPRPAWFRRKAWTFETTIGARPHWGDWRAAIGLDAAGRRLLERCAAALRDELAAFGDGPERFGLVHADLRLANLLVDGDRLSVIDFDDSGFGWFAYDFAAAISFFEHEPVVEDLAVAWLRGYRSVAPLGAEEEAALPVFVMLRRLLLTAWVASHAETPTAEAAGAGYTNGTLDLAERFLSHRRSTAADVSA